MKMQWNGNYYYWLIDWLMINYFFSYDEMIKIDPKDKDAWNNKGILFYN